MNYPVFSQGVVHGDNGVLGFIFGLGAFVRLEKLINTLKEKGLLDEA